MIDYVISCLPKDIQVLAGSEHEFVVFGPRTLDDSITRSNVVNALEPYWFFANTDTELMAFLNQHGFKTMDYKRENDIFPEYSRNFLVSISNHNNALQRHEVPIVIFLHEDLDEIKNIINMLKDIYSSTPNLSVDLYLEFFTVLYKSRNQPDNTDGDVEGLDGAE